MGKFVDLTGKQFGRLTVLERIKKPGSKRAYWKCQCKCGKMVFPETSQLNDGRCKSCGCLREEMKKKRITHGDTRVGRHGKLYNVWSAMKGRCYTPSNTSYNRYGALGIKVCEEWRRSYEAFKKWALANRYQEGLSSIDRIDSKGDYSPSNCRWVTNLVQANNKKNNVFLTYKGVTKTLSMWAREKGLSPGTLRARLSIHNWSLSQALETPLKKRKGGTA
jgi:hypothetical protein